MKLSVLKYKIKILFLILTGLFVATSCVDDKLLDGTTDTDTYDPSKDPNMMCLPLGISLRNPSYGTRNEEPAEGEGDGEDEANQDGFIDGTENNIDFVTPNESFAIFFEQNGDDDIATYISQLYSPSELGEGEKPANSNNIEYSVNAMAYIPQEKVNRDKTTKFSKVLVVLNGGKIYNTIDVAVNNTTQATLEDILNLKWSNPANYENVSNPDDLETDNNSDAGPIGYNAQGLFTMTNSAYYDGDQLMTATPITGKAYSTLAEFLESKDEPAAKIYVERMLAKFSVPTFLTDVIGSERVFRPDQNAFPVIVHWFDQDGEHKSEEKKWRIHLLGWTINGNESESFIFKHIPAKEDKEDLDNNSYNNWSFSEWNDAQNFRSYWSIDPHYSSDKTNADDNNPTFDFYPWQFRKAANMESTISIQTGLHMDTETDKKAMTPVLRYNSFNYIQENDAWGPYMYLQENTFDPTGNWYDSSDPTYLDDRASYLAAPHLVIIGELYLEDENGPYESSDSKFGPVDNIYSDRLRRYYMTEKEWFKMFVYEFNKSLATQEKMKFTVYDWDENSPEKPITTYTTYPSGKCQLYLRQNKNNSVIYGSEDNRIDGDNIPTDGDNINEELIKEDSGFWFTPVTFELIDDLFDAEISLSALSTMRNGDGRLIPWIEGEIGQTEDDNWKNFGLVVRNPYGGRLPFRESTQTDDTKPSYDWGLDMYKSLFYEWFGPIDHYLEGKMYYAGDIRHKETTNTDDHDFYGTVRNHWYKFQVASINSLGIPVDDPTQLIIPGKYNYRDQIVVYLDVIDWHPHNESVGL